MVLQHTWLISCTMSFASGKKPHKVPETGAASDFWQKGDSENVLRWGLQKEKVQSTSRVIRFRKLWRGFLDPSKGRTSRVHSFLWCCNMWICSKWCYDSSFLSLIENFLLILRWHGSNLKTDDNSQQLNMCFSSSAKAPILTPLPTINR